MPTIKLNRETVVFLLSGVLLLLLVAGRELYLKSRCMERVIEEQRRALAVVPLVEREIAELKGFLAGAGRELPSGEEAYLQLLSAGDAVSHISCVSSARFSPLPLYGSGVSSYRLTISMESSWSCLSQVLNTVLRFPFLPFLESVKLDGKGMKVSLRLKAG